MEKHTHVHTNRWKERHTQRCDAPPGGAEFRAFCRRDVILDVPHRNEPCCVTRWVCACLYCICVCLCLCVWERDSRVRTVVATQGRTHTAQRGRSAGHEDKNRHLESNRNWHSHYNTRTRRTRLTPPPTLHFYLINANCCNCFPPPDSNLPPLANNHMHTNTHVKRDKHQAVMEVSEEEIWPQSDHVKLLESQGTMLSASESL